MFWLREPTPVVNFWDVGLSRGDEELVSGSYYMSRDAAGPK